MRNFLISAALVALCSSPASAHGGRFTPSGDAGAGGAGAGGIAGPPTNPGGSTTATGGVRSGGSGGLSGGRGQPTRGVSGRGGGRSGGQQEIGPDYAAWEFWWEHNKDRYLDLRERLGAEAPVSGSPGALSGRGRNGPEVSANRPSAELVMDEILPRLRALMESEDSRDVLDSSILALARSVPTDGEAPVTELALPLLAHPELSVQTSAALSLGVLSADSSVDTLTALMVASTVGRRIVGGGEVPQLMRAFGALGLGLVNSPHSVEDLVDVVRHLPDSERDTKVCAIVALGMMDNERIADAYPVLFEHLADRRLDPIIKSYIPTTLAKIAGGTLRESVAPLSKVFANHDTDNQVRRSTAIALGRLATMSDTDVIDSLSQYVRGGSDAQTRHFALISLGKIGARDAAPQKRVDAHTALVRLLKNEVTKPSSSSNAPWAALASALYARGEAHEPRRLEIAERVVGAYSETRNPSSRAAYAIALGLMNDTSHAEQIFDDFRSAKDNDFRGFAAVALGLMGHTEAAGHLRDLVRTRTLTPTFRLQLAEALGALADRKSIEGLMLALDYAKTLGASSAIAKALGLIGDGSVVAPLLDLAEDENKLTIARAFAAVAVGVVAERTSLPFNARISEDNNYRARVPAIEEILDIL